MKRRNLAVIAAAGGALLTATTAFALGPRVPDPIPGVIPKGDVTIGLKPVATGLNNPVTATHNGIDNKTLFVVEQNGKIWAVDVHKDTGNRRLFADLSSQVVTLGCFGINYDERGLSGLAFHPDYKKNGLLYTFYATNPVGQGPAPCGQRGAGVFDHDNVVVELRVKDPKRDNATVDPASAREVMRIAHPQFNHNGGELRFGPDGYLYVSTGDGGSADDQGFGHSPQGNAQDLSNLLGKILRIDPNAGSAAPGYSTPSDNPFVGTAGARGEIWAFGFRNPYKMSFDGNTLYAADVGQGDLEEVDIVVKGGNYGWPVKEGSFAFDRAAASGPAAVARGFVTADVIDGFIEPIAEYDHCVGPLTTPPAAGVGCPVPEGIAVVGGFVYDNSKVKELRGKYVFGDYSQNFNASTGRLFYLDGGQVKELKLTTGQPLGLGLLGIGQDEKGEIYVLGKSGARPGNTGITDPANTTGVVLRIVSADDDD